MNANGTHEKSGQSSTNLPAESGHWQVVAGSIRGTSHEKTGQPCQDAHHWDTLSEGVLVAAVADGAGSASLGEVGAAIAAQTAVAATSAQKQQSQLLEADKDWKRLLMESFKTARTAIENEAKARDVTAGDLATTLILIVATGSLVAVAQVGDGATVIGDEEGNIIALTTPQRGEYINETTFLTSPHGLEEIQMTVWRGRVTHVAAFSDGLQMLALKMPDGTPHAPFFSPLFRFVAQVTDEAEFEAFLSSPGVIERTDDDLTLILAALVE